MTDKDTGRPEGALGASGTGEPEAPGDDPLGDTADLSQVIEAETTIPLPRLDRRTMARYRRATAGPKSPGAVPQWLQAIRGTSTRPVADEAAEAPAPEVGPESVQGPEPELEAEPEQELEAEPEPGPEPEAEFEAGPEPESEVELEPEAGPEPEPEQEPEAEPEPEPETSAESEVIEP